MSSDKLTHFADRLGKALEISGIGTQLMAERIGVNANSVRNWLRGSKPHPRMRQKAEEVISRLLQTKVLLSELRRAAKEATPYGTTVVVAVPPGTRPIRIVFEA